MPHEMPYVRMVSKVGVAKGRTNLGTVQDVKVLSTRHFISSSKSCKGHKLLFVAFSEH
jgi:hypothetical protein